MDTMEIQEKTKIRKNWTNSVPLTSLGWQLALPIVGGAILGYQLDRSSPNQFTYTLIFIVLGIIVGYYNIYKLIELEWLRTEAAKRRSKNKDLTS